MINRTIIATIGVFSFCWYVYFIFGLSEGALDDRVSATIGVVVLTILPIVIIILIGSEVLDWVKKG